MTISQVVQLGADTLFGVQDACEESCPFAQSCAFTRYGQECPDVRDAEAECVDAGVSLWDVLLGARPAP